VVRPPEYDGRDVVEVFGWPAAFGARLADDVRGA